jgi:inner membrane protease ATP23
MQALTNSGCAVSRAFVQCAPCDVAGFFDKSAGVTLCQNQFDNFTDNHVTRVLRHELTHAYDFCRADLSTSNCLHVACTEIRASMLSGECSASQEALRLQLPLTVSRHFPACVRRRALLSLEGHPHCKAIAAQAVDAAWNRCYNDQEPFDHRP